MVVAAASAVQTVQDRSSGRLSASRPKQCVERMREPHTCGRTGVLPAARQARSALPAGPSRRCFWFNLRAGLGTQPLVRRGSVLLAVPQ